MAQIHLLSQDTINKIAAGEVIERPMAVAKELIENAVDAKANAITVEIQDGGKTLIRITDNGSGIPKEEIALAFTPHATSKIREVDDLSWISSLGFRGEALASIASVSQLEVITKPGEALMGVRCLMDGGEKKAEEAVGCPDGTTFLVRNLFYNTPARLKFLKTAQTEAGYISSLVERMALSRPDIAFRFINQKQTKLSTPGNGNLKDVIYHIYGRDIAANLIAVSCEGECCKIQGFIGKPAISRASRSMMSYFINGRYIKSALIQRALEEAYAPYVMNHRYPFTVLHITTEPQSIDVNVHPQKMEIRFHREQEIFQDILQGISEALKYKELIPEITFSEKKHAKKQGDNSRIEKGQPEPFETKRLEESKTAGQMAEQAEYLPEKPIVSPQPAKLQPELKNTEPLIREVKQETLFDKGLLSSEEKARKEIQIVGQVFATYWILQYEDTMYLVDQHAAHEKVLYERLVKKLQEQSKVTQLLQPPVVLTLSMAQQQAVEENREILERLGYQMEPFGGREYAVSGVPAHLPAIGTQELLLEVVDSLTEEQGRKREPELLLEKVASMSCKAAVKGNSKLPPAQMEELLRELMTLENPYHCPHGRPTMISMAKTELEKRFKRIL